MSARTRRRARAGPLPPTLYLRFTEDTSGRPQPDLWADWKHHWNFPPPPIVSR